MESLVPGPLKVLIVDDEPSIRQMLQIALKREGYDVVSVAGCRAAIEALGTSQQPFPVVLTDLSMPDGSGFDVLSAAKRRAAASEVILITAHSSVENAIAAMRGGAYDFVTKPFQPAEITALVQKALEKHDLTAENTRLRARIERTDVEVLGRSPAMRAVLDLVDRIAATKTTVLITGRAAPEKSAWRAPSTTGRIAARGHSWS